jgi:predicted Zn-dependent protease
VITRLSLVILAAAIAVSCADDPLQSAREYIARGDDFARQGRPSAAVIEYRNAVRDAPAWSEAHEKLGDALVQAGRIEEAYREYTVASRIVDGQPLPQGEDDLRAAVRDTPSLAAARVALADLLLTRGEVAEAEQHLLAAAASEPENELAQRALAAIYLSDGKPAEAEQRLKAAAAVRPQRYRSQLALADFLMEAGRLHEARTVLQEASVDARLTHAVKVRLAALDYEGGAIDKAHRELDRLLETEPSPEAWTLRAELQLREHKLTEALDSARRALTLDPEFAAALAVTEDIRREQLWPSS